MNKLRCSADAVALLEDELRRDLYLYVRQQSEAVTRDEVATFAGISGRLAAFHLDKLVDKGLLRTHYARKPGRSGPGAGRSSKFYAATDIQIEVSIPERHYDFVGEILVESMQAEAAGESPRAASIRIATERGRALGTEALGDLASRSEEAVRKTWDLLDEFGFEPHEKEGVVSLRSCPFHSLAKKSPELVCRINQAFIDGFLQGIGDASTTASLEPAPGRCCVRLRPAG